MADVITTASTPDKQERRKAAEASDTVQKDDRNVQPRKPGIISHATGWHVWKRQFSQLGRRASFPLLRQVWKSQVALSKTIVPHNVVPDEYLIKTKKGHKFLIAFMAVVLFWGILTTVKGFAAGVLHGMWINNWIIGGIPIVILASARLVVSYRVVIGVEGELNRRTKTGKTEAIQEHTK